MRRSEEEKSFRTIYEDLKKDLNDDGMGETGEKKMFREKKGARLIVRLGVKSGKKMRKV